MAYKVVVTNDAKENMQEYIEYILYEKKNQQAAGSLLDDFEYTKDILAEVAGSLKLCDNEKLRSLGYRRISFKFHRYFMLYRVEDTTGYIDGIFHELQDFENKINWGIINIARYNFSKTIVHNGLNKTKTVYGTRCYYVKKGNNNLIWPYKFNSKWQCTHVTLSVILMCN